jgi:hypothetical protein
MPNRAIASDFVIPTGRKSEMESCRELVEEHLRFWLRKSFPWTFLELSPS